MESVYVNEKGLLTMTVADNIKILPSPIGILCRNGTAHMPLSAKTEGEEITVEYPHGTVRLRGERKNGYFRLMIVSVPEGSDGFSFGPYETGAEDCGSLLGAAWYNDGSAVCIQALHPQIEGGNLSAQTYAIVREDKTDGYATGKNNAAEIKNGKVYLQCRVHDRRVPRVGTNPQHGTPNFIIEPMSGPEACIENTAIALLYAENAETLTAKIGELEIAENLPHPQYRGQWAKTDPRVSSYYLIIDGGDMTNEERIAAATRANVNSVYFCDVIGTWGHFDINAQAFPGGVEEVNKYTDGAYEKGILVGAHSLTNFIHTHDRYVTPVPHEKLLYLDRTSLAHDISDTDSEITVCDETNYASDSALNTFRIGNELITYKAFDKETKTLTGCIRGAFGTKAEKHLKNSEVKRLVDHGYQVFFPNIELQSTLAEDLGTLIRDCGIRKFSFDGLEGTCFSGHGDAARNIFVKKICDKVGDELLCDGSNITHYLWHAFSYCNWGEPWYDDNHRGGMYAARLQNQEYFRKNLIPRMMGWYQICENDGRWEATPPETMEFILSRSAAFNAGSALSFNSHVMKNHGKTEEYLDLIRLWGDFRMNADIPSELRESLAEEHSNWHLEETDGGYLLTELSIRTCDLAYRDRITRTEAGYVGYEATESSTGELVEHHSLFVLDGALPSLNAPERVHMRIRVGEPGHGCMEDLTLWDRLSFKFHAEGGDYLEYTGGNELYHYDANFRLKEVLVSEGAPIILNPGIYSYIWGYLKYKTNKDEQARYTVTEIREKKRWFIPKRS